MFKYSYVEDLTNHNFESFVQDRPFLRIDFDGRVAYSHLAGGNKIGSHSTIIRCLVGRFVGIGCYSFVSRSKIGNYCTFGSRISIGGSNHDYQSVSTHEIAYRDTNKIYGQTILEDDDYLTNQEKFTNYHVEIGNDVWIGDNAVVLPGRKIATGAVIGAGAIVTSDVPPYAIVVGNPGRIIKYRFSKEIILRLLSSNWWDRQIIELKEFDFLNVETFLNKLEGR